MDVVHATPIRPVLVPDFGDRREPRDLLDGRDLRDRLGRRDPRERRDFREDATAS